MSSALGNLSFSSGAFRTAVASLAVLVVAAAGIGYLLVDEFSSGNLRERTASSTFSLQSYFAEIAAGRSEGEAQAIFRALQTRFPSLLGNRDPVIRPAASADSNESRRYVAAVGPFASMEQAGRFCQQLKAAGAPCTTAQLPR